MFLTTMFKLQKHLFFILLPVFVLAVPVGTLHHETGHYLAANSMGLKATIHYDYTHADTATGTGEFTLKQQFWFIIWGPLQTMLTGTVALLLLCFLQWQNRLTVFARYLLTFIAMFWVRQPINLLLGLLHYLVKDQYPVKGDEAKLSRYYHLPIWCLNVVTGFLGALVIATVIFRFVPARQRFTFWLAGTVGGAAGFYCWMIWLGKSILP